MLPIVGVDAQNGLRESFPGDLQRPEDGTPGLCIWLCLHFGGPPKMVVSLFYGVSAQVGFAALRGGLGAAFKEGSGRL